MTYTTTPELGLQEAVPGSGQAFETTAINSNWGKIDARAASDRVSLATAAATITSIADLAALALLTGMTTGNLRVVQEGGALFEFNGTAWAQQTEATFASSAARDSAYAKASSAFLTAGARVRRTDKLWTEQYFAGGTLPAGWFPVYGNLPIMTRTRAAAYSFTTTDTPMPFDTQVIGDSTGTITYSGSTFTVAQAGIYEYEALVTVPSGSTYASIDAIQVGAAYLQRIGAGQVASGNTALRVKGSVTLGVGAQVAFQIQAGSTQTGIVNDGSYPATFASLRYIGHA